MKKMMMVALVSSTLALSGCGAMSTAIKKRNLEVKTQMSETVWLEPSSERTVFLQIKNTSDKDMSGLQSKITEAVKAKGYQVVTSPDKAYYWIQANVLKADKWTFVSHKAGSAVATKVQRQGPRWVPVLPPIIPALPEPLWA